MYGTFGESLGEIVANAFRPAFCAQTQIDDIKLQLHYLALA